MTILGWRRPGKITQRLHLKQQRKLLLFLFSAEILRGIRVASAIRPVWAAAFSAGLLVDLNRAGDSLYQGGEFFAEIQRGVRRTTAVGKRVDTTVSTLLTPVSLCFLVWRRSETGDRPEKGNGRGSFLPQGSTACSHFSTYSQCQILCCYTCG